jgi:hypothetical protein
VQQLSTLIEDLQQRVARFHLEGSEEPLPEVKVDVARLPSAPRALISTDA